MINGHDTDIYVVTKMMDEPPAPGKHRRWPLDKVQRGGGFDFPIEEINNVRAAVNYWCTGQGRGEKYRVWAYSDTVGKCKRVE